MQPGTFSRTGGVTQPKRGATARPLGELIILFELYRNHSERYGLTRIPYTGLLRNPTGRREQGSRPTLGNYNETDRRRWRTVDEAGRRRILVVGGSGRVGRLVLPALNERYRLTVFDRNAPDDTSITHMGGEIMDFEALEAASEDHDALLYMAMGSGDFATRDAITTGFDVSVKGLYLALEAAHEAGISHAVYTSSMSVYDGDLLARKFPDEEIPPDSSHVYGLTKRLGEEVCRVAARRWGMTINALRLCLPVPDEKWIADTVRGTPTIATAATDVQRALIAAIERPFGGFEAFMISGDYEETSMRMAKARRLLDWAPLARPIR